MSLLCVAGVPPDKQEEIEEKINILTDKINVLVDQAEQAGCKVIKPTFNNKCCGSGFVGSCAFGPPGSGSII
jgi:hypothetical protein